MQEDELRETLSKLFASDSSAHEERRFFFPRVVDSSYKIVGGLNGKEILKYIVPCMSISVLVLLVPPYNSVVLWIIKLFLFIMFFLTGILFALLKPISSRPNIRLSDYVKSEIDFIKRQKVFFIAKKDKNFWEKK